LRYARPESESIPVFNVAVDAQRVYFNDGAGRLWTAPKDGSAPPQLLVSGNDHSVRSFVVHGDEVFFATRHAIGSVAVTGGDTRQLVSIPSDPILLVGDGQFLYHTVFDGSATYRISVDTHKSERFCPGGKHQTLAVDDDNLYVASYYGGTISAIAKKTRHRRNLVEGAPHPVRVAVDDRFVYFTNEGDGTVRRVPKRGGRVEVLARNQEQQEQMTLDAKYLYWATRTPSGEHALMRILRGVDGANPERAFVGLRHPGGMATDDGFIYVANKGSGDVLRIPKSLMN
jgi:hypothetical protein